MAGLAHKYTGTMKSWGVKDCHAVSRPYLTATHSLKKARSTAASHIYEPAHSKPGDSFRVAVDTICLSSGVTI